MAIESLQATPMRQKRRGGYLQNIVPAAGKLGLRASRQPALLRNLKEKCRNSAGSTVLSTIHRLYIRQLCERWRKINIPPWSIERRHVHLPQQHLAARAVRFFLCAIACSHQSLLKAPEGGGFKRQIWSSTSETCSSMGIFRMGPDPSNGSLF